MLCAVCSFSLEICASVVGAVLRTAFPTIGERQANASLRLILTSHSYSGWLDLSETFRQSLYAQAVQPHTLLYPYDFRILPRQCLLGCIPCSGKLVGCRLGTPTNSPSRWHGFRY